MREFWIADHCLSITFRGIRGKRFLKENLSEDWCASSHLQSAIHNLNSIFPRGIAQLVERQLCKLEVRGSNPLASSLFSQESNVSRSVTSGFRSFGKSRSRMAILLFAIRQSCASSNEQTCVRALRKQPCLLPYCPPTVAKYAVNTPVIGSMALPVISPLLFMSFALVRTAE